MLSLTCNRQIDSYFQCYQTNSGIFKLDSKVIKSMQTDIHIKVAPSKKSYLRWSIMTRIDCSWIWLTISLDLMISHYTITETGLFIHGKWALITVQSCGHSFHPILSFLLETLHVFRVLARNLYFTDTQFISFYTPTSCCRKVLLLQNFIEYTKMYFLGFVI